MDNGLIFPYPLTRAQTEPTDTKTFESCGVSFGRCCEVRGWPEVVVGE
jgi:hypothetical protein